MLEAGDRKVSMRHPYMLPDVSVIDPDLTLSMPRDVTAHTGMERNTVLVPVRQTDHVSKVVSMRDTRESERERE